VENGIFCSQLSAYFKRHVKFKSKRGLSDCVEDKWRE
jgi:hypothetical protein